ncbi:hypothetical protein GCM10027589_13960 [Actinocorallia lasiicapitis]
MSKFFGRVPAAAATLALGGTLLSVSAAPAAHAETLPNFSFAACPALPAGADPVFWQCNVVKIYSGTLKIGRIEQSLSQAAPITLTYANGFDPETLEEGVVFGGFSAPRYLVQRGIFGDPFLTAVYVQPKYVGGLGLADGKLQVSLKFSVQNILLGAYCTIGTNSNPIKLDLGIGQTNPPLPNTPISGSPPEVVQNDPPVLRTTVVDNAFSVPGADRCGLNLGLYDGLVNLYAKTPAAAGRNTAILQEYTSFKTYDQLG